MSALSIQLVLIFLSEFDGKFKEKSCILIEFIPDLLVRASLYVFGFWHEIPKTKPSLFCLPNS